MLYPSCYWFGGVFIGGSVRACFFPLSPFSSSFAVHSALVVAQLTRGGELPDIFAQRLGVKRRYGGILRRLGTEPSAKSVELPFFPVVEV